MRLNFFTAAAIALALIACDGPDQNFAEPAPKPSTNSGSNSGNNPGTDPGTDPGNDPEIDPDRFIFDTDLFEKHTDSSSGIVSYLLKSGVGDWECSQSTYFVNRCMTNDERFIFFFGSNKDFSSDADRHGMILDLRTRKIYSVPNCHFGCCPYLDPVEDKLYYGHVYDSKRKATFYRRDLLVDPAKDIKLADLPLSSIRYTTVSGSPIKRLANHLTLTQDKKKVFLDMRLEDQFVYGLLDLYTGAWEEWGNEEINLTHGELNPVRDDIALMAIDKHNKLDKTEVKIQNVTVDGQEVYPRLQLVTKGTREVMIPDMTRDKEQYPGGYASHERWDESGEYVYWCSGGICIRNVATDEFKKYTPTWASHCFFSKDREYVAYDDQSLDFYRGCRWRVAFYNIATDRMVYIHTMLPALATRTEMENSTISNKMASLHPDPHPQFVCNDKYVISTAQRPDKTIRLSITPVDQLINATK